LDKRVKRLALAVDREVPDAAVDQVVVLREVVLELND